MCSALMCFCNVLSELSFPFFPCIWGKKWNEKQASERKTIMLCSGMTWLDMVFWVLWVVVYSAFGLGYRSDNDGDGDDDDRLTKSMSVRPPLSSHHVHFYYICTWFIHAHVHSTYYIRNETLNNGCTYQ